MLIVADTSVLLNFLKIGREQLLTQLPEPVAVTNHVREELTVPEQRERLVTLTASKQIQEIVLDSIPELQMFARFMASGRLGPGECSALTHGILHKSTVALDDTRAIKEARKIDASVKILQTQDIVVRLIKTGQLTIQEADAIKQKWAKMHRFALGFSSFQDIL
jgi:predicted nucleic acid-binding protein